MKYKERIKAAYVAIVILIIFCGLCFSIGFIPPKIKEYHINKIASDYHMIHTYSEDDFFVCFDMAIDLWNIYRTAGYNAKIALGNIHKMDASIEEIDHAWLMVEISPFKWVAIETTTGQTITIQESNNEEYYANHFVFHSPAQAKEYVKLRIEYLDKVNEAKQIAGTRCLEYKSNIQRYNNLITEYTVEKMRSIRGVTYDVPLVQTIIDKMDALKIEIDGKKVECEKESETYAQKLLELQMITEHLALLML